MKLTIAALSLSLATAVGSWQLVGNPGRAHTTSAAYHPVDRQSTQAMLCRWLRASGAESLLDMCAATDGGSLPPG